MTKILSGEAMERFVRPLISEKHQVSDRSIILTVKSICETTKPISLDFGGSEYKEAEMKCLTPKKKKKSDEYGWWKLKKGDYIVEFNETVELRPNQFAILQAWEKNSLEHETKLILGKKENLKVRIYVDKEGANIKENARFSELFVFELSQQGQGRR